MPISRRQMIILQTHKNNTPTFLSSQVWMQGYVNGEVVTHRSLGQQEAIPTSKAEVGDQARMRLLHTEEGPLGGTLTWCGATARAKALGEAGSKANRLTSSVSSLRTLRYAFH